MNPAAAPLLVDVRPLDHPTARDRGIGRYIAGLLGGLAAIGAPAIGLYGGDRDAQRARIAAPGLELRPWGRRTIRDTAGPATWYLATQLMLHPVVLDPIPSVVTGARLPVAAVMYDVIPYRRAEQYQRAPSASALARIRASLARTVDGMLAISRFSAVTAAEELRFPLDRIRVIGAGVDGRFVPPSVRSLPSPERVLEGVGGPYVVAVTGADVHKNTEGLLRAWAELDPAVGRSTTLVIATAAPSAVLERWRRLAADVGVASSVVFTGWVSDDEMVALLQRARLAILPSFDEGFGLPVVEAAACGCPAICSDASSLTEVLDEPAARFDPNRADSIARAIERGLTDDDHRAVLAAAAARAVERFTWERVATDTLAALAELGSRWAGPVRSLPRRLALAGPEDPTAGGVDQADSLAGLATAVRRTPSAPRVDLLVDRSGESAPVGATPGRYPVRALGRYLPPWDFDDVVARIGPAPLHQATVEIAGTVSCHVWLHAGDDTASGVDLARARSIIVADDRTAQAIRAACPDGPPILVLPDAGQGRPAGSAAWTVDDVAAALVAWLDDVGQLPADTIRRPGIESP